ncbi:MAG: Gfo/Idh/MocA family protein, partial [Actinomycetota bacterium]
MTRAGIVGAGFSATSHIDALRRVGVEVAAVVASTEDKAYAIADRYGIPKAASHYEEVLADDDIGAIHNCTPNYLHAEINEAALRAGKHLLSEKPLGMSSAETARLAALADEVDTVTAVCFNYRHYPLVRQAREMLDAGSLGPPHFIHGDYLQDWLLYGSDWNWRLEKDKAGGSRALADIGSHWLDLVQYLLQDHVTEVLGRLGT